jgi:hypothetical protein
MTTHMAFAHRQDGERGSEGNCSSSFASTLANLRTFAAIASHRCTCAGRAFQTWSPSHPARFLDP